MINYLSKADLIYLNQQVVTTVNGLTYGVLSDSSLEMIIEQPQQIVFGQELYPTIWLKAAFILQKIAKKHAFRDGNKRTAIMASLVFLAINGYQPIKDDLINNADDFVLSVTNSPDTEATMLEIARWLEMVHVKV
ncbi:death-on-curing (DOC) family protein [Lactococcus hodotermopsidis]|uniref:Death-on-curing (DOC) family protein n=1 Tax=Pseudolactococcus hodotermopsidis TaxID=2709157 RepID=A0A6A0BF87_9LACT|nr:type II toxin-antitoxin system death-on-curing family toxin [Lactococcus hodotermopsidis]GFH43363.1 death-on-curing (DOC) family protein [Lactococcus hodotermopsidis]